MKNVNPATLSSAALAYLGDSVIEICVRRFLVSEGISHSAELNASALSFVRAGAQSEAVKLILPILTEDEEAIWVIQAHLKARPSVNTAPLRVWRLSSVGSISKDSMTE